MSEGGAEGTGRGGKEVNYYADFTGRVDCQREG